MSDVSKWFGFRLVFLEESDQDAVQLSLSTGIVGYTLRLELKDGTVHDGVRLAHANAHFDEEVFERDGALAASWMEFERLNEEYDSFTPQQFFRVRYEDIEEIGVY
jgi:hypothetical protein